MAEQNPIKLSAPARRGAVCVAPERRMAWSEWGPADGAPVLFSPGAATSSLLGFAAGAVEPTFAAAFASAFDEGFVQGPDGFARDTLLAMQRWPFDPAEIRQPVHLWYGSFDASPFHSLDFGASLARRIPGAARTIVEGAGGSILWTHGTEILEALLEARQRAGT
jgi:pimeloyl-ACP methyl ester carboxylesterase